MRLWSCNIQRKFAFVTLRRAFAQVQPLSLDMQYMTFEYCGDCMTIYGHGICLAMHFEVELHMWVVQLTTYMQGEGIQSNEPQSI